MTEDSFISKDFADFASSLSCAQLPSDVIEGAKLHILDALGVGLAASTFDFAEPTLVAVRSLGGNGDIPVIAFPARLALRDAILVNGTLIHGLDFDDTHPASIVHPSASAVATMLGSGARYGASGHESLLAYILAVEIDARLGTAVGGAFHQVGLHPTGLLGAFGCTLAAGRLAGLQRAQLIDAQGIVLSMAGGSLEFLEEGAWTKRLHPGWAGVCAVTAVALAEQGFLGPRLAYEGRFGLYRMHLGPDARIDWAACTKDLGSQWETLQVALKPYPACHFTHAFIDATLALTERHDLTPEQVESITACIAAGEVKTVCEPQGHKRRPSNPYDAQFSVHYTIAASLARGRFTLEELSPECVHDPDILALCDRIHYQVDPSSAFPKHYSGEVIVSTYDGRILRHREQVHRGDATRPLSTGDVISKFQHNAALALPPQQAQRILERVMVLDSLPTIAPLVEDLSHR